MPEPLRIVARIVAASSTADRLEVEMNVLVDQTRKEPGCLRYDLLRGTENPDIFVFVEAWQSKALWEAHMAGDAIRSFNARIGGDMIASGEIMQLKHVAS